MNKNFSILTAALLLGGASSAFAASSTDLTVKGLITPRACTPSLSSDGTADHGKISVQDLLPDRHTQLPPITLQMAVSCDAATAFALSPTDHQAGSATHATYFGLGLINGSEKLGHFRVTPRNVQADNVAAQTILSYDNGLTWLAAGSRDFWGVNNIWGFAAVGNSSIPIAIKDLTLDLQVRTAIAATDGLTLTDDVSINGSATLQIKYL